MGMVFVARDLDEPSALYVTDDRTQRLTLNAVGLDPRDTLFVAHTYCLLRVLAVILSRSHFVVRLSSADGIGVLDQGRRRIVIADAMASSWRGFKLPTESTSSVRNRKWTTRSRL